MKNIGQKFLIVFIGWGFFFSLGACSSLKTGFSNQPMKYKLKRSWVRRLAPAKSLRTNEIAQNFNPIVKENGNVVQASSFGGIFELNKYGQKKWSYGLEQGIAGSGSVYKNFVFFGTQDKYLHAYDTEDNSILWSTPIEEAVSAISELSNGRIFVLTDMGNLYAIKAGEGIVDWKISHSSRKALRIYGGAKPVIFKDQVVAAFPNGVVTSLNQTTGKAKWTTQLEGAQKHEDVDFLSFSNQGFLIAGVFDEALYRLALKTGKIIWQAYEKPVSELTIFKNKIYFSNAEGFLITLGLNAGNLISKKKIFRGLGGKPLFLKGKIIVTDSNGPIRVIDKDSGKVLAHYDLVSATSSAMSLSKAKDKFYLLSDKGYLYYFGLRN